MSETYKITIENKTNWYCTWLSESELKRVLDKLDIQITQSNDGRKINLKQEATKKLKL